MNLSYNEIINSLESAGIQKTNGATLPHTYSDTAKLSSLIAQQSGNRSSAHWKTAQYIIVKHDNKNYELEQLLEGWKTVIGNHRDQYLLLEELPGVWKFYDSYAQEVNLDGIISSHTTPKEETVKNSLSDKYRPYITAIKSKPFLLLAGISGTGKSRIARELARSCWATDSIDYQAHKPSNFEIIQVKPNWHDSSELIGYVSRISGEPQYIVGDFVRFITRAWENWLDSERKPYFLCLDEMNLAPVEQYLAEYLSVIESRKWRNGEIVTDPLIKNDIDGFVNLVAKLAWKSQKVSDMYLEKGICLPPNLIIIGTVNMDETTFSFSRKVLDRAMTIEMNEVNLSDGLEKKETSIRLQSTETLIGNAVEPEDIYLANKKVCDICIDYLNKINTDLEGTPFKIAYRTRNEVLLYVVNNLPYQYDLDGNKYSEGFIVSRALDEVSSMKILSRIEGDEFQVSRELLHNLKKSIIETLSSISDGEYISNEKTSESNSISLAKLSEMERKLDRGYTNFWS
jgi:hypothetical protein